MASLDITDQRPSMEGIHTSPVSTDLNHLEHPHKLVDDLFTDEQVRGAFLVRESSDELNDYIESLQAEIELESRLAQLNPSHIPKSDQYMYDMSDSSDIEKLLEYRHSRMNDYATSKKNIKELTEWANTLRSDKLDQDLVEVEGDLDGVFDNDMYQLKDLIGPTVDQSTEPETIEPETKTTLDMLNLIIQKLNDVDERTTRIERAQNKLMNGLSEGFTDMKLGFLDLKNDLKRFSDDFNGNCFKTMKTFKDFIICILKFLKYLLFLIIKILLIIENFYANTFSMMFCGYGRRMLKIIYRMYETRLFMAYLNIISSAFKCETKFGTVLSVHMTKTGVKLLEVMFNIMYYSIIPSGALHAELQSIDSAVIGEVNETYAVKLAYNVSVGVLSSIDELVKDALLESAKNTTAGYVIGTAVNASTATSNALKTVGVTTMNVLNTAFGFDSGFDYAEFAGGGKGLIHQAFLILNRIEQYGDKYVPTVDEHHWLLIRKLLRKITRPLILKAGKRTNRKNRKTRRCRTRNKNV
jgi:hypothetical protein